MHITTTAAIRIHDALEFLSPGWRPDARADSWDAVRDLRADAATYSRLSVDFLMAVGSEGDDNLARYFAAKALVSGQVADEMAERLGGAL